MNNLMNAKEEKLRGRHRDTHTALQWLRENRQLFVGNVYEPMMLVVSPSEPFAELFILIPLHFNEIITTMTIYPKQDDRIKFVC